MVTTQQVGKAAQQAGEVAQDFGDTASHATEQQGDGRQQGTKEQAPAATQAAERLAEELGADLSQVEGSGVGERITVTDVRSAAQEEG